MSRKKLSPHAVAYALEATQESRPHHRSRGVNGAKRYNKAQQDNVITLNSFSTQSAAKRRAVELIPKTVKQEEYVDQLLDVSKTVVFATGPAGTGKTMLAVLAALKAYKEGKISKIVITRPAIGVDEEQHGFLPGTLNDKMAPWTRPIFDVIKEYYSVKEVNAMLEDETIEICPLAFMRGRTFKNAMIIFDEAQSSSVSQMKMALTRIGDNSRMLITGDLNQNDRKFTTENGLADFLDRLAASKSKMITQVHFGNKDIMRHPIVQEVLSMYGEK